MEKRMVKAFQRGTMGMMFLFPALSTAALARDLTEVLVERKNMSEAQASESVKLVFDTISSELNDGRDVRIQNFGRFKVVEMKARKGRNPRTGEPLDIPKRRYPRFTADDALKESVGGKRGEVAWGGPLLREGRPRLGIAQRSPLSGEHRRGRNRSCALLS